VFNATQWHLVPDPGYCFIPLYTTSDAYFYVVTFHINEIKLFKDIMKM
jgi:hypothetical protein